MQIGIGALCRKEIDKGTPLGMKIKDIVEQAKILDIETVRQMIEPVLEEAVAHNRQFVVDGYPKTWNSFNFLTEFLAAKNIEVVCINMFADDDVCIERIASRFECHQCARTYNKNGIQPQVQGLCDTCNEPLSQRKGDDSETVRFRMKQYHENAEPITNALRERYPCIDVDTSKWPVDYCEQFLDSLVRVHK